LVNKTKCQETQKKNKNIFVEVLGKIEEFRKKNDRRI
jgi:hypothetical protein